MKKFYDTFLEPRGGSTANNKLSPVNVYVPVAAKDEMPVVINKTKFSSEQFFILEDRFTDGCFSKRTSWYNGSDHGNSLFNRRRHSIHWLKEQERYIFTKEELCKFISDTLRDFDDKYNYTPGMKLLAERKEYIQSLF